MRRILSLILSVACIFSCLTFSGSVVSADEPEGDLSNFYFKGQVLVLHRPISDGRRRTYIFLEIFKFIF